MAKLAMLLLWTAVIFGGLFALHCWRANRRFAETAGYGMLGMVSISNGLEDDSLEELDRERDEAKWKAQAWRAVFFVCLIALIVLAGRGWFTGTWLV